MLGGPASGWGHRAESSPYAYSGGQGGRANAYEMNVRQHRVWWVESTTLRSSPFSLLVCPHLWSIFFPSSLPLHVLLIICPMTRVFIRWIIRLSCPSIHRPNSPGQVELKLRIGTVEWIVGKTRQALHSSCYKAPHQHAPHPHNRKNNPPLTTDQVLILSNKKKRRIYISPFAGIHLRIIIGLWCVVERTREPQTLPSLPPPTRCGSI
jgi:hypothetical protein